MANKLYLDNKDYDVPYEPSDSEDEYSEEEKQILKEVREGKKRKTDPKQELLAFDESADDDDDIIGDSDIERGDEQDGIPDAKAWGKQRRSYYNTDFVDQDYSAYNEQEEEQAQQEEEEAKAIQLRLAKQLNEADFFLDLPTGTADTDDEDNSKSKSKSTESEERIKLKSDLSGMSQRQKQQLFEKDSPEFAGLVGDFQTHLTESQSLLNPILEFSAEKGISLPIVDFVQTKNNMILTYCTNIAFYLLLKSNRIPIKNHPVTKRLVQMRKLLIQLQQKYVDVVKPQLQNLLEKINSGEEVNIVLEPVVKKTSKKLRMMKAFNDEDEESDEEYDDVPTSKRAKLSDEEGTSADDEEEEVANIDENDEADRRGITYQIAKNKGLMPHRKKELRNPRVKHRSKFRKALIRRKGAVRTVRKETKRYGGEVSGIKATVKKGIKIKS